MQAAFQLVISFNDTSLPNNSHIFLLLEQEVFRARCVECPRVDSVVAAWWPVGFGECRTSMCCTPSS